MFYLSSDTTGSNSTALPGTDVGAVVGLSVGVSVGGVGALLFVVAVMMILKWKRGRVKEIQAKHMIWTSVEVTTRRGWCTCLVHV